MLFKYKAIDSNGINKEGQINAPNVDIAISGLQRRSFVVLSIKEEKGNDSLFSSSYFNSVSMREVVILSRQIATLFEAQVSALKAFTMLAINSENKFLGYKLTQIRDDLEAGVSISRALAKHPEIFSEFYVNMVRAGEETGKLNEIFSNLAEYLDRQNSLNRKTKNALIYPIFVIITFFTVMGLMFVFVIPKLSAILVDSGQEIPLFTKIIIGLSNFFVNYGLLILIFLILFIFYLFYLSKTKSGKIYIDKMRLSFPVVSNLYKKLYLSRIAGNLDTMLVSGIPIVRSIDITSEVVSNLVYKEILKQSAEAVKSGLSLSASLEKYPEEIPGIMVQMIKVGEETGSLGQILKTLSNFYKNEVDAAVDTLVGMIEPVMIIVLGLGVGILIVSVLMPIYNMAGGIN